MVVKFGTIDCPIKLNSKRVNLITNEELEILLHDCKLRCCDTDFGAGTMYKIYYISPQSNAEIDFCIWILRKEV